MQQHQDRQDRIRISCNVHKSESTVYYNGEKAFEMQERRLTSERESDSKGWNEM